MRSITERELKIIEYQLGRKPTNLLAIALYCPYNRPAVLLTNPYENDKVFPTLYWLSCPKMVKKVSKLEDEGLVQQLTIKQKREQEFSKKMEEAHIEYAQKRMFYLQTLKIDFKNLPTDIRDVLENSGVGGIRKKEGIKCLHAHLADYMVNQNNPAGRIVFEMVEWPLYCDYCPENKNAGG
ncbi:MAG: DUF501 domain-containing protein [Bacillota bacterium]